MIVLATRDRRRRGAGPAAARRDRRAQRVRPPAGLVRDGARRSRCWATRPSTRVFIRAPVIERVGPDVDVIARLDDGRIVAVRERNVIATAFHPELAGRDALPPPGRDDGGRARGSRAKGSVAGRIRRVARRPGEASDGQERRQGARRPADRPRRARRAVAAGPGRRRRDAVARAAGVRTADRRVQPVPAAARRVHAARRDVRVSTATGTSPACCASSARARATSGRSSSSTPSATSTPGDVRFRLVQHLLRDGAKRGAVRFHVACADADDNVELFMQAGFVRYGDERVLYRDARSEPLPAPMTTTRPRRAAGSARPAAGRGRRCRGCTRRVTPQPVQRLEDVRLPDWERQGRDWRVPRSSLAPILRFADVEAFVQQAPGGGRDGTQLDAFVQVGVAKEDQPHYLKVLARPEADIVPLLRYALGVIAARATPTRAPSPGRARPRPHLRIAGRPAARRGGLRLDRDRHAPHEGNPRPGRRAAPRAGRRPLSGSHGGQPG